MTPVRHRPEEDLPSVPADTPPGRSLVTRRAILDVVRTATLGSYGITGFAANPIDRLLGALGARQPGIRLDLDGGLALDLHVTVAWGLPVAEVARQVDSAVRYAVRRSVGREIDRLTIHVGGLRVQPGSEPPRGGAPGAPGAPDAAAPAEAATPGSARR